LKGIETPTDRLQGYRLHISSNGARALEHCLPATLFKDFLGSAAKSNQAVNFLDSNLKRLLTFAIVDDPHAESREIPVSRMTVRKVLLRGLENVVNFEKRFQCYEQRPDGSVVAHFEVLRRANRHPRGISLRWAGYENVEYWRGVHYHRLPIRASAVTAFPRTRMSRLRPEIEKRQHDSI
jgi:hypothetical protein